MLVTYYHAQLADKFRTNAFEILQTLATFSDAVITVVNMGARFYYITHSIVPTFICSKIIQQLSPGRNIDTGVPSDLMSILLYWPRRLIPSVSAAAVFTANAKLVAFIALYWCWCGFNAIILLALSAGADYYIEMLGI